MVGMIGLRWPFRRAERRISAMEPAFYARSASRNDVGGLGIVEACRGMWQAAIAGARIEGERAGALRDVQDGIGRSLCTLGVWSSIIDTDHGGLRLREVSRIQGESTDTWRVTVADPANQDVRVVSRDQLLIVPWGFEPGRPWRFIAPHLGAAATTALADSATGHGVQSLGSRLRWLLGGSPATPEQHKEFAATFHEAIEANDHYLFIDASRGEPLKSVTTATDSQLYQVLRESDRALALAHQVPPALVGLATNDPRAAARRWNAAVSAKLATLEREARIQLDDPTIRIATAPVEDIAARARAYGVLTRPENGFDHAEAAAICGLHEPT